MNALSNPHAVAIGLSTLGAIAESMHKAAAKNATIAPVQCFAHKRFMRSTIYGIRVCTANGVLVFDAVTYGQAGDLWQVSTDDGSTYQPVSGVSEVVRLCGSFFALWQD